jgi:hypothetical protein
VDQYVFVRLHAREGEESAVEEALREVTGPSREEPGCLSFHIFRSTRDRRIFYIHSKPTRICCIPCDSSNAWMLCLISLAMSRGQK